MTETTRRRITFGLILVSGATALMSAGSHPSGGAVYRETSPGVRIYDGSIDGSSVGFLFAASMLIATVCALVAFSKYVRNNRSGTRRALLIAAVFGIPAVVPGLLALMARFTVPRTR